MKRRVRGRSGPLRVGPVAVFALALAGVVLTGCTGSPILANPVAGHPSPPAASPGPVAVADPAPIAFPADDGPHHRLTEWWYYTGHLRDSAGRRFGFEFVVFRAERGDFPISWASHLALTDESGGRFLYGQRTQIGPQVDQSPRTGGVAAGFSLGVSGADASRPASPARSAWTMAGAGDRDRLSASLGPADVRTPAEAAGFGLDLALATDAAPVLHDRIGFVSFGAAGGSYYYSRPRMAVTGRVNLDSVTFDVTGEAWFDHQWGDFITVGSGGWDWFAINLADGTDLTLSLVRDGQGGYPLVYGTLAEPDGAVRHLDSTAFSVEATGSWTSPTTAARYPAGWHVRVPSSGLDIQLQPTVAAQELDTRPSTGVVYWEGSQVVTATRDGRNVAGEAYVELTGYGPTSTARP